jgi:tetratricopeptide (TPR) repeat protein
MTSHPSHPTREALWQLITELPHTPSLADLKQHVDQCPPCQQVLDDLIAQQLAGLPRGPAQDIDVPASLVEKWVALGPPLPIPEVPGYEIEEELGHGGMGIVYRARQDRADRRVALKVLLVGGHADPEERERFRTEAQAIARLQHPHIVQIFEVGEHQGLPFFSLELCPHGSLADYLAGTPLEPGEAASLVRDLAGAMAAAHRERVVHRDLKPANVLLAPRAGTVLEEGERPPVSSLAAKITDFGLAKKLDEATRTQAGAILGTPSYMAPEQAKGDREVGPAADVYALGAILYECLTGRPPFKAATTWETLAQVRNQEPAPPRQLNSVVPRDLQTICLKCLQKDPRDRYASARELEEDLRRFLKGEAIQARPMPVWVKVGKWIRRRPAIAALWGLGGFLVLVLLAGGVWLHRQQQADEEVLAQAQQAIAERQYAQAAGMLDRVEQRWGILLSPSARERIQTMRQGIVLAAKLEEVGMLKASITPRGVFDVEIASERYPEVLLAANWNMLEDDPGEIVNRMRRSVIREQLIAALLDWSDSLPQEDSLRSRLLEIAVRADSFPWLEALVLGKAEEQRAQLAGLAKDDRIRTLPSRWLVFLGMEIRRAGGDPVPVLEQGRTSHPADVWLAFTLGNLAWQRNDIVDAIAYYGITLGIRPGHSSANNNLGVALAFQRNKDGAITWLRTAVTNSPRIYRYRSNLAAALMKRGGQKDLEEAVLHLEKARDLAPDVAGIYQNLSEVYRLQGKNQEAVGYAQQFAQLVRNQPWVQGFLARTLLLCEEEPNRDRLRPILRQATKPDENPERAEAWLPGAVQIRQRAEQYALLGEMCSRRGWDEEAIACLEKALTLNPQLFRGHHVLAWIYLHRGLLPQAEQHFCAAIRQDAKKAEAWYGLGQAQAGRGLWDQAVTSLREAVKLDRKNAEYRGLLGITLFRTRQWPQAQDALEEALKRGGAAQVVWKSRHHLAAELTRQRSVFLASLGLQGPSAAKRYLPLAYQCFEAKEYTAAVVYFRHAFTKGQVSRRLAPWVRYDAACAAVLAAEGKGKQPGRLTQEARSQLRRIGLGLLLTNLRSFKNPTGATGFITTGLAVQAHLPAGPALGAWMQLVVSSHVGGLEAIVDPNDLEVFLQRWETEADLGSVRDKQDLLHVPREERLRWQHLWKEVGQLRFNLNPHTPLLRRSNR